MTAYFLMLPAADDVLLLAVIFSTLTMVAYAGKMTGRIQTESACAGPGGITGPTLTLSGLLIGFVFSVSLSGFSARGLAELQETQSVASAWQYTILLPAAMQREVQPVLRTYLDDRIHFFREETTPGGQSWVRMAEMSQQKLWQTVVTEAGHTPSPVMASVLSAFNSLMTSQHQTSAVWKRQIPDAAWLVLIVFAASACFLVGHQYHERGVHDFYLLLLPALTSLVLFVIAEIDIPGQGIIRVMPDDLEQLSVSLMAGSTGKSRYLSAPVHPVPW